MLLDNIENIGNLENIDADRLAKLENLINNGYAWPNNFKRKNLANILHQEYDNLTNEELTARNIIVKIAGRIMLKRHMGKASFITLQDMSGRMQIYLQQEILAEQYEQFKVWDLGDIVGIKGTLFKTKTNELSVKAAEIILLTKSFLFPSNAYSFSFTYTCLNGSVIHSNLYS